MIIPNSNKPSHELKMPTGSCIQSSSSDSCPSSSDSDTEHNYEATSPNKKPAPAIRKDGMAVCELCGNTGVKHAFYSKSKRYCSLACSRASAMSSVPSLATSKTSTSCQVKDSYKRPIMAASSMKKRQGPPHQKKIKHDLTGTFDWRTCLNRPGFSAASVSSFKHVSLSSCWDSITIGMKLEIENTDCENLTKLFPSFYWIASVIRLEGYYALLRYEGFETDDSKDFWVNLCTDAVHPVGWCASQGKPLIPPKSIEHKYVDWKDFLVKRLTGARTFPADFSEKLKESLISKFRPQMRLEVVDKNRISAVRVARVLETLGGRLHVAYESAGEDDDGFWCHEQSLLIHPVGWAQIVGHDLRASQKYAMDSLQKSLFKTYSQDDASWDLFQPSKNGTNELRFKEGMKLEAIDPLNLSTICVATVTRVLRNNYLMIGIDGMMAANGSDWFCYHATSPCIFPVGFCDLNNIELTPPRGHKGIFKWFDYLKETKSMAAPVSLFKKEIPNHGFKQGMQVEAVDLMEPRLVCVGSISKVVGRLLRLHFDGWDQSYDQWCDCESPDLFPIGWCEAVGYKLESPRLPDGTGAKKKKKSFLYKGARKKRRTQLGGLGHKKQKPEDDGRGEEESVSSSSEGAAPGINGSRGPTTVHSPREWGVLDVAQFLRINECGAYCQLFSQKKIDGSRFLSLTKDDLLNLTGMKVGPSLKIFNIIQQLNQL